MPDKTTTTYISTSGEISLEEVARAQAMYASERQEGEDKSQQEMPSVTNPSATGTMDVEALREAVRRADDQQSDSAPTA